MLACVLVFAILILALLVLASEVFEARPWLSIARFFGG